MLNFQVLEQDYNFKTTLKNTSYDSANKIYLSNLSIEVYDFDKIKDEYVNRIIKNYQGLSEGCFRSNDVLYRKENKLVFIEFKNGDITSKLEKEKIRSKISESLLILADILNTTLSEIRKDCSYILVYNKNKNESFEKDRNSSINRIGSSIAALSGKKHLIQDFYRYKVFFDKVYTINETEFDYKKLESTVSVS
ncbi:hypothetical protein E4O03_09050 [Treponema sp. OMZ 792]|uniref:hypothetical protein n=1 Tax=unclassified Treponema TaxID=2638727 RepID=UPI0020A5EB95|nr:MULTISPECIES: hypothetical protein [unclassified Treponema]UTC74370.1 hypothetical protein E4O03_09050 [Treponema sp. OMZ 792]UTC80768.1 hypothetical protein E4O07_08960 [Treponema sp. OMZ 798]